MAICINSNEITQTKTNINIGSSGVDTLTQRIILLNVTTLPSVKHALGSGFN